VSEAVDGEVSKRPRGRPRLTIDRDAVADAVAALFAEGGYEAVSIVDTADKLGVSRATLYRAVPTKEDLLGILFERCTGELTERTKGAIAGSDDPAERLTAMIRLQADAAVSMRSYMAVFFGGAGLPPEVYARWHSWSRQFEKMWVGVVSDNMERGYLDEGNPTVTARLILGMIIWVSRWYRPREKITPEEIADTAIHLVRLGYAPPRTRKPTPRKGSKDLS
jgi:AcrR family transcriptional regulator